MALGNLLKRYLLPLMLLCPPAFALNLGDATVFSHLNQPLYAEIPLQGVSRFEVPHIELELASKRQFERMGIEYRELVEQLSFLPVKQGDGWYVQVHTSEPVEQALVSFPLKLRWADGQIVRAYTFMLELPPGEHPLIANPAIVAAEPEAPATDPTTAPSQEKSAPIESAPTTLAQTPVSQSYGPVKAGESLWPIATKLRSPDVVTEQMAIALLKANPEAFEDGNVNKLKQGSVLQVPSMQEIMALNAQQARTTFYNQVNQWKAERDQAKLAEVEAAQAEASDPTPAEKPEEIAEDTIKEEPNKVAEAEQNLRIIPSVEDEPETANELEDAVLRTREEIEANRLANEQFQTRIDELENQLNDVQRLISLKDQQLANLQTLVEQGKRELELSKKAALEAIEAAPTNAIKRYIEEQQRQAEAARPVWQKWLEQQFGWKVKTEDVWQALAAIGIILALILLMMLLRSRSKQEALAATEKADEIEDIEPIGFNHRPRVSFAPLVYDLEPNKEGESATPKSDKIDVNAWASEIHRDVTVPADTLTSETREERADRSASNFSLHHNDVEPANIPSLDSHDDLLLDDSVAMNLELAQTYIDLDDIQGAKKLLKESLGQTNNKELLAEIRAMLKTLDE